ncbi:MAG: O-antigen ligase family protein, partial [Planctomycetota bacterium]
GYLIPATLYWIARNSVSKVRDVNWFYGVTIVFSVYLAGMAFFEMAQLWAWVFPRYIADPGLGIHFGRARGPYLNSVRLGIYLSLALGMTWITLVWRGVWGRAGHLLGLGLCTLLAVAISLTYTRSVWLGLGVAGLIVCLLTFRGMPRRTIIVATLLAATLLAVCGQDLIAFKREFTAQATAQSTRMRAVFTYVSWLMFQDRPLTGFGFGHYASQNRPYLNDRSTDLELQSIRGYVHHNTLLSLLVELGLLGFLPFVLTLMMWSRTAWCLWRDRQAPDWMRGHAVLFLAFSGFMVCQMVFHDTTYSVVENGAFFCCAGILSGIGSIRGVSFARPLRWESRQGQPAAA